MLSSSLRPSPDEILALAQPGFELRPFWSRGLSGMADGEVPQVGPVGRSSLAGAQLSGLCVVNVRLLRRWLAVSVSLGTRKCASERWFTKEKQAGLTEKSLPGFSILSCYIPVIASISLGDDVMSCLLPRADSGAPPLPETDSYLLCFGNSVPPKSASNV